MKRASDKPPVGKASNQSQISPLISLVSNPYARIIVSKTQAQLAEQSITYNQNGVSYNQLTIMYGGAYGLRDVVPLISIAKNLNPRMSGGDDIYTNIPVNPNGGLPRGPGFFLYLTY